MKKLNTNVMIVIGIVVLIIIVLILIFALPGDSSRNYWLPSHVSESELGIYTSAAISLDVKKCSPIGKNILQKGGSVIDAAIAVMVCMGVSNPQFMGFGGGFMMTVYIKERAPADATENMFQEKGTSSVKGSLAIAVPGELKGYELAYKMFGKLNWSELFHPTIKMCNDGIKVGPTLAKKLSERSKELKKDKKKWDIFMNKKTDDVYREGDDYFCGNLVKTLEAISNYGSEALYNISHNLARKFLGDLKNMKSIITKDDLESYNATAEDALQINISNGLTVYSSRPPGSGALLGMMLKILNGYNITEDVVENMDQSTLTLHRILETFKFTFSRQFQLEDNQTTMSEFVTNVTSSEYAAQIREKINDETTHNTSYYGLKAKIKDDHGIAFSVAVIAPNGDAAVATSALNSPFGCSEISKGTGIILNNHMDDFSIIDKNSSFNIRPSPYNRIKPNKRPVSSISPTIVVDSSNNVRLAIGADGAKKITTSILQVIVRNLWLKDDIKQSIDAPRLHHQLEPNIVEYEREFPQDNMDELIKKNHVFGAFSGESAFTIGISRKENNKLYANADNRNVEGGVDGY